MASSGATFAHLTATAGFQSATGPADNLLQRGAEQRVFFDSLNGFAMEPWTKAMQMYHKQTPFNEATATDEQKQRYDEGYYRAVDEGHLKFSGLRAEAKTNLVQHVVIHAPTLYDENSSRGSDEDQRQKQLAWLSQKVNLAFKEVYQQFPNATLQITFQPLIGAMDYTNHGFSDNAGFSFNRKYFSAAEIVDDDHNNLRNLPSDYQPLCGVGVRFANPNLVMCSPYELKFHELYQKTSRIVASMEGALKIPVESALPQLAPVEESPLDGDASTDGEAQVVQDSKKQREAGEEVEQPDASGSFKDVTDETLKEPPPSSPLDQVDQGESRFTRHEPSQTNTMMKTALLALTVGVAMGASAMHWMQEEEQSSCWFV